MEHEQMTIYELVGGDPTFRKLVDAFYEKIAADPTIRGMFPDDLEPGKEGQFLFLAQYFGGPARYIETRGHPRLRMRHAPFTIDQRAAETWLSHMLTSIDEIGIEEPARSVMRDYFERAAPFMVNYYQPEDTHGT